VLKTRSPIPTILGLLDTTNNHGRQQGPNTDTYLWFGYIQEHVAATGSAVGQDMLANWDEKCKHFVKVFPHDLKRVLGERDAAAKEEAA
jgi:hypothetical protein